MWSGRGAAARVGPGGGVRASRLQLQLQPQVAVLSAAQLGG